MFRQKLETIKRIPREALGNQDDRESGLLRPFYGPADISFSLTNGRFRNIRAGKAPISFFSVADVSKRPARGPRRPGSFAVGFALLPGPWTGLGKAMSHHLNRDFVFLALDEFLEDQGG
jgi:hypothetical protein